MLCEETPPRAAATLSCNPFAITNEFGRITPNYGKRRNIFGHDRTGCDYGAIADGNAMHHNRTVTKPSSVTDLNRAIYVPTSIHQNKASIVNLMISSDESHSWSKHHALAYHCWGGEMTIYTAEEILSDCYSAPLAEI